MLITSKLDVFKYQAVLTLHLVLLAISNRALLTLSVVFCQQHNEN